MGGTEVSARDHRRLHRSVAVALAIVVTLLALAAACGGDDDEATSDPTALPDEGTPTAVSSGDDETQPTTQATPVDVIEAPEPQTSPDDVADQLEADVEAGVTPGARTVQAALLALCFYDGEVDGDFGPRTTAAVKDFQSDAGLDVDGIVGPMTAAALAEALPSAPSSCAPGSFSSDLEISALVDGEIVVFDRDVVCLLGPDDAGSFRGTSSDGRTIQGTLDGTASRVQVTGGATPIDAEVTLASNTESTLTVKATPPDIEVRVPLSVCDSA